MTSRIIVLTFVLSLSALPALANSSNDHSGFGKSLFAQSAPAGFNDPIAYIQDMDAAAAAANDLEPADGDKGQKTAQGNSPN